MPDYDGMTLEEVETELTLLSAERAALGAKAKQLAAARERKVIEKKVADMPAAERDALKQVLGVASVATSESVGTPGAK